ncbi:MAG TPA: TlpA disulfide reductase family protein [Gemmatimonadaceae bacterium]
MRRLSDGTVKRWSGRAVAFVFAAAMIALPTRARAQDLGIEVGSSAPSARVQTLDGREAELSQNFGKGVVVMEFWATWCPNCKELEPELVNVLKKYDKQVKFIGVAVSVNQSAERVKAYVEKHSLPGEHYFDAKGNATGAYDVPATSYVVVVNKAGKVVYTGLGGKQNLEAAIKKAL